VPWDQQFFEPIPLPKGKPLATLRDAALYITKLAKAEHDAEEWQTILNLETLSEQARRVLAQAQSHLDEIERGNGD
jgi:hypothetical protein